MELIKGEPITEFCDHQSLTTRARLGLFVNVCLAVQHAHLKGIIHRDIKPSNILVTLHDGEPVVKVIDFGIAKAIGQQLTEKTLHTAFAEMVGTPMYMSPEQAGMSGLDIDTRTDIYSLGVLLYELLTGTTPFDPERLRAAGYDEMRRIVREEEPPKPSTRRQKDEGRRMKDEKKRPASSFSSFIPHPSSFQELDWIVMKALEKDRTRRYESVHALAADVQRYLRDEPVLACPPSNWYRFSKLARRHKAALTTAGLLSLTLVAATVVLAWKNWQLQEQEQATRHQEQATERELERAQKAEEQTTRELFEALVAEARANRRSRRSGQRFRTLEILRRASAMARQLQLPEDRFLELCNEAIATLALTDLRVAQEWPEDVTDVAVRFDAALERYACAYQNGKVQVRRAGDGGEIFSLPAVGPGDNFLAFSPDGGHLAVWESALSRLHVWKLAGANPPEIFSAPTRNPLRFSPDGRRLALQEPDGSINLLDLATGKKTQLVPEAPPASQMAWHPAGDRLAIVCFASAQVHDLATGRVLWQKNLSGSRPRWIQWNPDGSTLAIEDKDGISL
jgi:hypothetical protein